MPVRRLNYTGRHRISREDVDIRVTPGKGTSSPSFDATLKLDDYRLPTDARVFVEAYRQTSFMRFDFGTVEKPAAPQDRRLKVFDNTEAILFRVKITSVSTPRGVLLAEADRIPLVENDPAKDVRSPLLNVKPDDIGDEVWRIDYSDQPLLLINNKISEWKAAVRSRQFASLVYPAVLREILTRILRSEDYHDIEDDSDWRALWLRFSQMLPAVGPVPQKGERDEFDEWIDGVVESFARLYNTFERFVTFWNDEVMQ